MKRSLVLALAILMLGTMATAVSADDSSIDDEDKSVLEASDVQVLRAMRLAEYFDEDPEAIEVARTGDEAIGWGLLYKLLLIADHDGMSLADYLDNPDFEEGWGIGKILKELRADPEFASDHPKNLGQWKKEQRRQDGWQPPGQAKKTP